MKNPADRPSPRLPGAFTLMELLVVVALIVILAGLVAVGVRYASSKAAIEKARNQLALLEMGIEKYHQDHASYPNYPSASGRGSSRLYRGLYTSAISGPGGGQAYLDELDPANDSQGWVGTRGNLPTIVDPWGNEYYYRMGQGAINTGFDLWSAGPDGRSDPAGYPYAGGEEGTMPEENRDDIRLW